MKLIQKGNAKLHNMYMWNMIASTDTCKSLCKGCYAVKEQLRYPSTVKARTWRYEQSKSPMFANMIISELSSLRTLPKYFRIHASSEFYSQEYIDKWSYIIKQFPTIQFYAYTKRLRDFDFRLMQSLPNMVLINSLHFGRLNYGKPGSEPSGAFVCPATKLTRCGIECTYCQTKQAQHNGVYFHVH